MRTPRSAHTDHELLIVGRHRLSLLAAPGTVTRLDPGGARDQPTGRPLPTARMVLTPVCAVELIRQCQQPMAALERAAANAQQAAVAKPPTPSS